MYAINRRVFTLGLTSCATLASAQGNAWPERPIKAIVPFAPGGNADVTARLMAHALSEKLGQPFVIENKAGAGGLLGGTTVARATPDGYTIMFGTPAPIFAGSVLAGAKAPYTLKDLQPVGRISTVPLMLVVHPDSPYKTFRSFAIAAKAQREAIRFGHAGNGTTNHVSGLQLQRALGTEFIHAAYKGSSGAVQDLMGGQIDASSVEISACVQYLISGRLRALAVIGDERVKAVPDVPTLNELGIKDVDVTTFAGAMFPKNVPLPIANKVSEAMARTLAEPVFQAKLAQLGATAAPMSPAAYSLFLAQQEEKYRRLVQDGLLQSE